MFLLYEQGYQAVLKCIVECMQIDKIHLLEIVFDLHIMGKLFL